MIWVLSRRRVRVLDVADWYVICGTSQVGLCFKQIGIPNRIGLCRNIIIELYDIGPKFEFKIKSHNVIGLFWVLQCEGGKCLKKGSPSDDGE